MFIENVDYGATKEELESLFCEAGKIVRVTILRDKYTNTPRGLAYVEFADVESVDHAIVLTGAELRGRFIRVSPKRTNIKGMAIFKISLGCITTPTLIQRLAPFLVIPKIATAISKTTPNV